MASMHTPVEGDAVSIVVVDDAKFTCEMIRRTLKTAGYHDIRVGTTAREGLAMMRERKANILLADWLMPQMDGLSLTARVRQIDEETNHYTYVILLTAKEGIASLTEAFAQGVDDFINKSPDNTELLARIRAAARISALQNDLLQANQRLLEFHRDRDAAGGYDAVTGLPTRRQLEEQIGRLQRHVESRGGGACVAVVRINDYAGLARRYGDGVAEEIHTAVAARLQQTVRPLDWVARLDDGTFGIAMHQDSAGACHPNAFRRVLQALNLRAYKTSNGFVSATAAVSLTPLPDRPGALTPAEVVDLAARGLEESAASGRVHMAAAPSA